MKEELVSIVTPVYNAEKYIWHTIKSVQNQEYENWEMIIVNDCSNDNSERIIKSIMKEDKRIRYIKLKKNSGVAIARNTAIGNAKGRFIGFLDADDIWLKSKLSKQINYMLKNKLEFTFTGYELIDENGQKLDRLVSATKVVDYNGLLKGNVIGCFTVIIDKEKIGHIQMPSIRHEDYVTWLNILKQGHEAYGINETLGLYRKMNTSLTGNKIKSAKWTWDVYRQNQNLSLAKTLYYFSNYVVKGLLRHVL